jgi:hypothetical protein
MAATASALLLSTACLLTGTKVFSVELDDIVLSGDTVASVTADLLRNSTYEEHRNDIEYIDRVGFETRMVNGSSQDATVAIWISEVTDLDSATTIMDVGDRIVDAITVAAGSERELSYEDILDLLKSEDALADAVKSGKFAVYAISEDGTPLTVTFTDNLLIVTFTVSL